MAIVTRRFESQPLMKESCDEMPDMSLLRTMSTTQPNLTPAYSPKKTMIVTSKRHRVARARAPPGLGPWALRVAALTTEPSWFNVHAWVSRRAASSFPISLGFHACLLCFDSGRVSVSFAADRHSSTPGDLQCHTLLRLCCFHVGCH